MRLFSSNSSSSTSNVYNTDNSALGAESGGVVLRDSTLTLADPGAIDLAKHSLDTVGAAVAQVTAAGQDTEKSAFDFLSSAFEKTLAFTGDTVSRTYAQTTKALEQSQVQAQTSLTEFAALADQSSKQGVQALTENVFRYAAWALVGIAAAGGLYAYASRTKH